MQWLHDPRQRCWRLQVGPWIATIERWPSSFEYTARLESKQPVQSIIAPHVFATMDEAQTWCITTIAHQRLVG